MVKVLGTWFLGKPLFLSYHFLVVCSHGQERESFWYLFL